MAKVVALASTKRGDDPRNMMLNAAPKPAPWVTPKKPGSTNGLRKSICITPPAAESDMPNKSAESRRGSLKLKTSLWANSSVLKTSKGMKSGWGYLPMSSESRNTNTGMSRRKTGLSQGFFFKSYPKMWGGVAPPHMLLDLEIP